MPFSLEIRGPRTPYNVAYGCFLFCGLVLLTIFVVGSIPMDPGSAGVVGILVLTPLVMLAALVFLYAFTLSIRRWRRFPLFVLAIALPLVAVLLATLLAEAGDSLFNFLFVIYMFAYVLTPIWWFTAGRKQAFAAQNRAPRM